MIPTLKSSRFRMEREADWKKLENLLDRFEGGGRNSLTDDEVVAIPVLYRATLSSLSMARAISLDKSLVAYLESLSTRAYFCVYGARTTVIERLARFFARDWPEAVQSMWIETVVSFAVTLIGVGAAYFLVRHSPEWFSSFVPDSYAHGRGPGASAQQLRETLHGTVKGVSGLTFFSSFLFTHNAQIALFAFALGFACCLPTAFLMVYQGLTIGAFFAVFFQHGLGVEFCGWLSIHGTTEIFACTLAGAAGFHIGWALAFPGSASRLDAIRDAGRKAAIVMVGVVFMLGIAGLLEGYGRQLIDSTPVRYAIGASMLTLWLTYFYLPRRRA